MERVMIRRTIIRTKVYEESLNDLPKRIHIEDFEDNLANNPLYWSEASGMRDVRKARFYIEYNGKKGGGSLFYIYIKAKDEIYLLKLYVKKAQENLYDEKINERD